MKKIKVLLSMMLCVAVGITFTSCGSPYSDMDFDKYITVADYNKLEVAHISVTVTDEEVNTEIQTRLEAEKTTKDVETGVVQEGDVVNIDYVGSIDGVKFEGGEETGRNLTIGSNTFIDGFESGLIGAEVGKTINIKVTFPTSYSKDELAGKNVVFAVKINSKEEDTVPPLDEKFVKKHSDVKTVEEYKALVKEEITEDKQAAAEEAQRTEIWTKLVTDSQMKKDDDDKEIYPQEQLDRVIEETNTMYEEYAKKNNMTLEDFVSQNFGMDQKTFNTQVEELAKIIVKEELVMYYIADKENIEVSRTDYKKYIQRTLEKYGYTEESFEKANNGKSFEDVQGKDKIKEDTLKENVQKFIVKNAKKKAS